MIKKPDPTPKVECVERGAQRRLWDIAGRIGTISGQFVYKSWAAAPRDWYREKDAA